MKIILISLLLMSCATPVYLIDKSSYDAIPKNSTKVVASVSYGADSLYNIVERVFSIDGWPITSNRSAMQISSTGKSIGTGTFMKPLVYIESINNGAVAYFSGEVGLDQNGQIMMQVIAGMQIQQLNPIVFSGSPTNRTDLGFQKLVKMANEIKDVKITYK